MFPMSFKNQVGLYTITLRKPYGMKNLVRGESCLRILVLSFDFYQDRIQVECDNRPDYDEKRKIKEDESVVLSENMKNLSLTTIFCRVCKFNSVAENTEEEIIVNIECNIDRNLRFVNGKVKSYGILLRNV